MTDIKATVQRGESISGEDLIDLTRYLGIDVHPRTIGAIRNHVVTIAEDTARVYRKRNRCPQSVHTVYASCQEALEGA